jgi:hypothetical protein
VPERLLTWDIGGERFLWVTALRKTRVGCAIDQPAARVDRRIGGC